MWQNVTNDRWRNAFRGTGAPHQKVSNASCFCSCSFHLDKLARETGGSIFQHLPRSTELRSHLTSAPIFPWCVALYWSSTTKSCLLCSCSSSSGHWSLCRWIENSKGLNFPDSKDNLKLPCVPCLLPPEQWFRLELWLWWNLGRYHHSLDQPG